ncbi:CU044_2847 family protein [Pelatocladus sp. BLCC-F211]|uniref:CU044_2847 family protein n=1 Tax=Pelatocladus sp. BLCC-F211 TaxID=3342752 RepID=UPI0035BB9438
MKRLIQFPLEDGSYILVEVEQPESEDSIGRIGREEDILLKTEQTFETALERVKPIANTIINKLRSLNQPADEVQVKFGIKMSAEAGAIIASASVEGNYEITLKWNQK